MINNPFEVAGFIVYLYYSYKYSNFFTKHIIWLSDIKYAKFTVLFIFIVTNLNIDIPNNNIGVNMLKFKLFYLIVI